MTGYSFSLDNILHNNTFGASIQIMLDIIAFVVATSKHDEILTDIWWTARSMDWSRFLDALASLELTQVSRSVSHPQFRQSHNAAL